MEDPLTQPVVCPVVVGRTAELTALYGLADRAKEGSNRHILLMHGEAGIGKSRLAAEVKAYAANLGFLVLQGNCFQGDSAVPYAPLLDLFRTQFLATSPSTPVPPDVQRLAPVLSRLVPELQLIPDLAMPAASPPFDPERDKQRLLVTVSHFFATQARRQPILLIIEDLHWSDEASLELLLHVVRACTDLPLLLMLTYRSEEVSPLLTHFLAACERGHLAQELSLKSLSQDDVAAMLEAIFAAGCSIVWESGSGSGTICPLPSSALVIPPVYRPLGCRGRALSDN